MEESSLERIIHYDPLPRSPRENLARNLYSARLIADGSHEVFGRVYRHTSGVILGSLQSIEDVDIDACRELGYEIVRRPTGGSAVVVSADQALCYSLFFKNPDSIPNVEQLHRDIVLPLAEKLGENVSVIGTYYLRFSGDGAPVAGHALTTHHENRRVVQLDGIFHDADPDVETFSRLLKLRELYTNGSEQIVRFGDSYASTRGKVVSVPDPGALILERSERDEIARSKGLRSIGVSESDVIEALALTVCERFGQVPFASRFAYGDLEPFLEMVDSSLHDGRIIGQGHCFVDFLEPEPRLH